MFVYCAYYIIIICIIMFRKLIWRMIIIHAYCVRIHSRFVIERISVSIRMWMSDRYLLFTEIVCIITIFFFLGKKTFPSRFLYRTLYTRAAIRIRKKKMNNILINTIYIQTPSCNGQYRYSIMLYKLWYIKSGDVQEAASANSISITESKIEWSIPNMHFQ